MVLAKNVLAAIGLVTVLAVSGIAVAFVMNGGESPSEQSDAETTGTESVGTDGLTYAQIQEKLQRYADMINNAADGKGVYLIVSGDVRNITTSQYSSISGSDSIIPVKGSAKVTNGDLTVTANESVNSSISIVSYECEYTIPYHAIVAIKIATHITS